MLRPLLTTLFALAPGAVASDGASLEAFLERARREGEAARAQLDGVVTGLLEVLEELGAELGARPDRRVDGVRERLVALGVEAAPLLVPHLDPQAGGDARAAGSTAGTDSTGSADGSEGERGEPQVEGESGEAQGRALAGPRLRASQASLVLRELRSPATLEPLLALAAGGSLEGRRNALRALGRQPEVERVVPRLAEMYAELPEALRGDLIVAAAELGGPAADALLVRALADGQGAVVAEALAFLAEARIAGAADAVLDILRRERADEILDPLIAYLRALPEVLTRERVMAIAQRLQGRALLDRSRVRLLELLASQGVQLDRELQGVLEPLTQESSPSVREAALVLLAIAGDRRARRELFDPLEQRVRANKEYAQAYAALAEMHLRVRDERAAVKQYRKALDYERREAPLDPEVHVGFARAQARLGNVGDAAAILQQARRLSAARLRELANDPDFEALAADPRYRPIFRLPPR